MACQCGASCGFGQFASSWLVILLPKSHISKFGRSPQPLAMSRIYSTKLQMEVGFLGPSRHASGPRDPCEAHSSTNQKRNTLAENGDTATATRSKDGTRSKGAVLKAMAAGGLPFWLSPIGSTNTLLQVNAQNASNASCWVALLSRSSTQPFFLILFEFYSPTTLCWTASQVTLALATIRPAFQRHRLIAAPLGLCPLV